ncbi:MAG: saccharopine dehydrogenase family protein [Mycobacterium sp.]
MTTLLIYGATGYTGRMAAQHAAAAGMNPVLGGRNASQLAALADELGVEHRAFALDDPGAVDAALLGVSVVLNCAGPFLRTAQPLMAAAIRCGVDYLDTAAELDSYLLAETLDNKAKAAGVLLLPGSGGSVAMLGCLTAHAVGRVTDPRRVRVALHVAGSMSRGSAVSAAENLSSECLERVRGELVRRNPDDSREFDFGAGPVTCTPATLPDLVTIWHATAIPNIETFVHVSGDAFPSGNLSDLPEGPSFEQRQANRYQASVEVTGADGSTVRSLLDTVNGYTFTPLAAVEAARRVLAGEGRPGFRTPASLFGVGFAETIADTRIFDI